MFWFLEEMREGKIEMEKSKMKNNNKVENYRTEGR